MDVRVIEPQGTRLVDVPLPLEPFLTLSTCLKCKNHQPEQWSHKWYRRVKILESFGYEFMYTIVNDVHPWFTQD